MATPLGARNLLCTAAPRRPARATAARHQAQIEAIGEATSSLATSPRQIRVIATLEVMPQPVLGRASAQPIPLLRGVPVVLAAVSSAGLTGRHRLAIAQSRQ